MARDNVTGINPANVTDWMRDRVEIEGELDFDLVAHGRSNLTFIVSDEAGSRWVLRRPPMGHVLASAHDMGREHRIIKALADSDVPVPEAIGFCDDDEVNGAPFYVMSHIEGNIVKTLADADPFTAAERRLQSESLVDTMAALHRIEPDEVGLGQLGKREDYVGRQLKRWKRQIDEGSDRDLPQFYDLHAALEAAKPDQQGSGIAHGDYRLDNCMVGFDNTIAAVLDWELCTLGDVLADLGGMLMWWGDADAGEGAMVDVPTLADGYLTKDEVVERYSRTSDRDVSDLPYYVAFQSWRLAAISEGVRVRFAAGAMGDKDIGPEMAGFETRIDALFAASSANLSAL